MPAEDRVLLEEGQEAPEIDANVTGGVRFRLSEQRGSWVVVYFYPRANTPG
jgi:thioredoxin-dependent peroxiredoxin